MTKEANPFAKHANTPMPMRPMQQLPAARALLPSTSHDLVVAGAAEEEVPLSVDVGHWLEDLAVLCDVGDLGLGGRGGGREVVAFAG
jgi:hypothetical protein